MKKLLILIVLLVCLTSVISLDIPDIFSSEQPLRHPRLGVGVHSHTPPDYVDWYDNENLGAGWFFTWNYGKGRDGRKVVVPEGMEFIPMVYGGKCNNVFKKYVKNHPELYPDGTIFMIGNEYFYPISDMGTYADDYHNCFELLKSIDPTYKLATFALQSYDKNLFESFRETYKSKYGSYPQVDAYRINIYSNIQTFKDWVYSLRQDMKDWGDQDSDLIITESCDKYAGGDRYSKNVQYIRQAFDFVTTERDENLGKSSDDYMLVQKYGWFVMNHYLPEYKGCELYVQGSHNSPYPPVRNQKTSVGRAFMDWVENNPPPESTSTTQTTISGDFIPSTFSCSQISGGYKCSLDYDNQLDGSGIVVFVFSNTQGEVVSTPSPIVRQGSGKISANFYCSSFESDVYEVSWRVYSREDTAFSNPLVWERSSGTHRIECP